MSAPARLQLRTEIIEQRFEVGRVSGPESAEIRLEHAQYLLMERAFRSSGGLIGGDEFAERTRSRYRQPISRLARWIVDRAVISFEWQANTILPLFQFDVASMTVRPPVDSVVRELKDALGDWEVALWFAQPNEWLDCRAPIENLDLDPGAVFDAARADRFIARC